MKKLKRRSVWVAVLFALLSFFIASYGQQTFAQSVELKEILIQVQPRMIEMPGNKATIAPLSATRVRSDDIKALNNQYNAVKVEKLFKLKEKEVSPSLEIKGLKTTAEDERQNVTEQINVAHVFTSDLKQGFIEKGEQVIELGNVFLIQFETDISVGQIVNSYQALDEVIFAETIIRKQ
jgi:hypothetical protein